MSHYSHNTSRGGRCVIGILLAVSFCTTGHSYQNGFEPTPDGYSTGVLQFDPDWAFLYPALTVEIIDTDGAEGTSQSLLLTGDGDLSHDAAPQGGGVHWVDFYLKPSLMELSELSRMRIPETQSAVSVFVKNGGDAYAYALDGDGSWGGAWLRSGTQLGMSGATTSSWHRVTYRLDYANQRWDMYLDGEMIEYDLGFFGNMAVVPQSFSLEAGELSAASTGFDEFYSGDTNPMTVDSDNDGIGDSYESAQGMDPFADDRNLDTDGDTISNIEEFRLGAAAGAVDSDGDQLHDAMEALFGFDLLTADANGSGLIDDGSLLPGYLWQALFESMDGYVAGPLEGQQGWSASLGVAVSEDLTKAVLKGSVADVRAEHYFGTSPHRQIWFGMRARLTSGPLPEVASLAGPISAVFAFSNENTLNAYDSARSDWLPIPLSTERASDWNEFAAYLNYQTQRWELYLNGQRLASGLGFRDPEMLALSRIKASIYSQGGSNTEAAHIEDMRLYAGDDFDGDFLSDDWERLYGFSPATGDSDGDGTDDALEDNDGDGLNNRYEASVGLSPFSDDTDGDGLKDNWSVGDSAPATPSAGSYGDLDGDQLANALENGIGTSATTPETETSLLGSATDSGGDLSIYIIDRRAYTVDISTMASTLN